MSCQAANDPGPARPTPYLYISCEELTWQIADVCTGEYFYARLPDGLEGERSHERRPLRPEDGEAQEMVLLNSTPATCTSIGLHNLYPGEIDLVITGPNVGRNSSTAFAMRYDWPGRTV